MATIYDVARLAAVSAKTVSRVLNGTGPVGARTQERIEAAMRALDYVPSAAASSMRSARSGLVGLITGAISTTPDQPDRGGLPDLMIVQGIQQGLAASGHTLMIADTGGQQDRVPPLIRTFLRHRVEGLLYVAAHHMGVALPTVPRATPMVLVNAFDAQGTPAVVPDDRRGARMLTERLLAAGHRRIGYLTLRDVLVATQLRRDGYRDALTAAGIGFDPALVTPCDLDGAEGEEQVLWDAIDRMLRLPDPPTVLMCGNDRMAMRVYGILRSRGVRVPEDLSVAGYDNHRAIAQTLFPPLTTVELPYLAMGVRAAEMLLRAIAGDPPAPGGPLRVAGAVHWRDSVRTVPMPVARPIQLRSVREE